MTFKTLSVSAMAKCGFSKFVGDSCGHGTSSADTSRERALNERGMGNL